MQSIITSHGLDFVIEGSGFRDNRDDFERGADAIREALDAMSASEVSTIHRLNMEWARTDCVGDRPSQFDTLENIGHRMATTGWHRPEAVLISVSAAA